MNVQIRLLNSREISELTALARSTYQAAYRQDMTPADLDWHLNTYLSSERVQELVQRDVVLVAVIGAQLTGFVQFGAADQTNSRLAGVEIRRLYVLPDLQNQGIGSRLLGAALMHPLVRASRQVVLGVWHTNVAAQRFYVRFGFVQVGERPYITAEGSVSGADLLLVRIQAQD